MVARALAVVPVVLCAACSLVLDPGNLPPQTDAQEIDARVIIDPSLLHIDSVTPTTAIPEGSGTGGSRRALIVLTGVSLLPSGVVTVELMGATPSALPFSHTASFDGKKGGLAVEIPVMGDCASGTRTIRITWTQGAVSQSTEAAKVQCLPELTAPPGATIAPLYSRIEIAPAAPIHFGGPAPIRLEAVADVVIKAPLDVNGAGATPGAFGCDGGAPSNPGMCDGGGKPGGAGSGLTPGGGGGGGGFGAQGRDGEAPSGMGGVVTGRDTLVPLADASNRGSGGGGGGKSSANVAGGPGGGGGGVFYLRAGGDVTAADVGAIRSRGGDGLAMGPPLTPGGGGGGGAGGAILVRAGGKLIGPAGWLAAPGGLGGPKGNGMWATDGGAGGVGRVRIDAGEGDVAGMAVSSTVLRGPAWAKDTPWLVDVEATAPPLVLRGQPGRAFPLRINQQPIAAMATPGADGTVMLGNLPLARGANEICAVAEPTMLQAESLACIDVFYTGR